MVFKSWSLCLCLANDMTNDAWRHAWDSDIISRINQNIWISTVVLQLSNNLKYRKSVTGKKLGQNQTHDIWFLTLNVNSLPGVRKTNFNTSNIRRSSFLLRLFTLFQTPNCNYDFSRFKHQIFFCAMKLIWNTKVSRILLRLLDYFQVSWLLCGFLCTSHLSPPGTLLLSARHTHFLTSTHIYLT